MLGPVLEQWLHLVVRAAGSINPENVQLSYAFSILSAISASVLIWRLWAFTVLPALRPNEPKEVPYWIPCKQTAVMPKSSTVADIYFSLR